MGAFISRTRYQIALSQHTSIPFPIQIAIISLTHIPVPSAHHIASKLQHSRFLLSVFVYLHKIYLYIN